MPEEPVELRENGLTVTAEFVSDEGLAMTWSQSGRGKEPIAIPLDSGKQTLRRTSVVSQLMMKLPPSVAARLVALLAEEYPDAFDPEAPD
jgi:hypothetical protein